MPTDTRQLLAPRQAELFRAGSYPDKGVSYSEADLDALVASFPPGGVPISFAHVEPSHMPVDLGLVVSVWRAGGVLMGSIRYTKEALALLAAQNARQLSIAFYEGDFEWIEVSHVPFGRIPTAHVKFGSDERPAAQFSIGKLFDLSYDQKTELIRQAMYALPDMADGGYIEAVYDGFAIVCVAGSPYPLQVPYTISDAGEVTLGAPVSVERKYTKRKKAASGSQGGYMAEISSRKGGPLAKALAFLRREQVDVDEAAFAKVFEEAEDPPSGVVTTTEFGAFQTQVLEAIKGLGDTVTGAVSAFEAQQTRGRLSDAEAWADTQIKRGRLTRGEKAEAVAMAAETAKTTDADGNDTTVGEKFRSMVEKRPASVLLTRKSPVDMKGDVVLDDEQLFMSEQFNLDPKEYAEILRRDEALKAHGNGALAVLDTKAGGA